MNTCEHVNPLIFTSKKKKNCIRKTKKAIHFFRYKNYFLPQDIILYYVKKQKKNQKQLASLN